MRAVELVWFPGSCSRVTLIALEEIGAPFTATMVPFGWRESLTYRAGLPSAPARAQPHPIRTNADDPQDPAMTSHEPLTSPPLRRRRRTGDGHDHVRAGRAAIRSSAGLALAIAAIAGCGGSSAPPSSSTRPSTAATTQTSATSPASSSGRVAAPAGLKECDRTVHSGDPSTYRDKFRACLAAHGISAP
jgi:hypothetical protein